MHEQLDSNCHYGVLEVGTGSVRKKIAISTCGFGSVAASDNREGIEDTSQSSHPLILKCYKLAELHYKVMEKEE